MVGQFDFLVLKSSSRAEQARMLAQAGRRARLGMRARMHAQACVHVPMGGGHEYVPDHAWLCA